MNGAFAWSALIWLSQACKEKIKQTKPNVNRQGIIQTSNAWYPGWTLSKAAELSSQLGVMEARFSSIPVAGAELPLFPPTRWWTVAVRNSVCWVPLHIIYKLIHLDMLSTFWTINVSWLFLWIWYSYTIIHTLGRRVISFPMGLVHLYKEENFHLNIN